MLTAKDVATELDVTARRVRALAKERGVGKKVAGVWLFSRADVRKLAPGPPGRPRITKKKTPRKGG